MKEIRFRAPVERFVRLGDEILLPIWKNPMLSIDDRYEVAIGEIERLNKLLKGAAARHDATMDEIEKLKSALRHHIMVYQVDDQAWDKDADADRIMAKVLNVDTLKLKSNKSKL